MNARTTERLRSALTFSTTRRNWLPVIPVGARAMNARLIPAILALLTATACDVNSITTQCLPNNSCWATSNTWTSWARADAEGRLDEMVDSGLLVPTDTLAGDECWDIAGTDRHLCAVHINGATLLGSPAAEYPLVPSSECEAMQGPWESTATAYSTCLGIVDGVAIEIRDEI